MCVCEDREVSEEVDRCNRLIHFVNMKTRKTAHMINVAIVSHDNDHGVVLLSPSLSVVSFA